MSSLSGIVFCLLLLASACISLVTGLLFVFFLSLLGPPGSKICHNQPHMLAHVFWRVFDGLSALEHQRFRRTFVSAHATANTKVGIDY